MRTSSVDGTVDWHITAYTRTKLEGKGFAYYATVTITCIFHPSTQATDAWYELTHVYVPSWAEPELMETSPEMKASHEALLAAAEARFEPVADDERKLKLRKLSSSKGIRGEITEVAKPHGRANKTQGGGMNMYGDHARRASYHDKVPGKAEKWADLYNRTGEAVEAESAAGRAMQLIEAHTGALQRLEMALLPEAGRARQTIAASCDPDAKWRLASRTESGQPEDSSGMSLSFSRGCGTPRPLIPSSRVAFPQSAVIPLWIRHRYVVGMHNDSGAALEAIAFTYAARVPLPDGHEWCFAVGGCVHPLPRKCEEFVLVAVRGTGVHHGTLPTSSTEPHFADHGGVGSALVNKADLVRLLTEPGGLPWPTPEDLAAHHATQREQGGLAKVARDVAEKQRVLQDAQRQMQASLASAAEAVGEAASEVEGGAGGSEAGSSAQGELVAAQQAIDVVKRQVAEAALDTVLSKAAERLHSMTGPTAADTAGDAAAEAEEQLHEDSDGASGASEAAGEEEEEEEEEDAVVAAASTLPKTVPQLLPAIADERCEFGLLTTAPSTLATPAFSHLKVACRANGVNVPETAVAHKKGNPLPEGYFIVKVSFAQL